MPSVINMGTAQRRKSLLAGLSEALAQGREIKARREANIEAARANAVSEGLRTRAVEQRDETIAESSRSHKATEGLRAGELEARAKERKAVEARRENTLSAELASQTLRKREQDIKNVTATHERFSMWWNGMTPQEQAIAKTSEQYKELQKFFKGFRSLVPGVVKDNGEIVAATNKTMFKDKLDAEIAKAKMKIASGTGTEADVQLLKLTEQKKDDIATVLEDVAAQMKKEKKDAGKDPRGFMQRITDSFAVDKATKAAMTPRSELQAGLTQPAGQPVRAQTSAGITQPIQPVQPAGNPNDPLGILGR